MPDDKQIYRRIDGIGPFFNDAGQWHVWVKTRQVEPVDVLTPDGRSAVDWHELPRTETFDLSIVLLPSLFVGGIVDCGWNFVGRRRSWVRRGIWLNDLSSHDVESGASPIDKYFVYLLPDGTKVLIPPLVLMQAMFWPCGALVRLCLMPGYLAASVQIGRTGKKGYVHISSGTPPDSFKTARIRGIFASLLFEERLRRSLASCRFETDFGSRQSVVTFNPPPVSVKLDIEGLKLRDGSDRLIVQQITSLKFPKDFWSSVPKEVEFVVDGLRISGERKKDNASCGGAIPYGPIDPIIDDEKRPREGSQTRRVASGIKWPWPTGPGIETSLEGRQQSAPNGAHVRGNDPVEQRLGAGGDPGMNSARMADLCVEEAGSLEKVQGSSLESLALAGEILNKRHPDWLIDFQLVRFPVWYSGRASLYLLPSGTHRRLASLEVCGNGRCVTALEIENPDAVRSLAIKIVFGRLTKLDRTLIAKSTLHNSMAWDLASIGTKNLAVSAMKHSVGLHPEALALRIADKLEVALL